VYEYDRRDIFFHVETLVNITRSAVDRGLDMRNSNEEHEGDLLRLFQ